MAQCGVHYQLMGSIQRKSDSLLQCATECTCDAVVHLKRPNPENYKTHQNPKTRFLGDNQVFGEFYVFFPKTLFFSGYGCLRYVWRHVFQSEIQHPYDIHFLGSGVPCPVLAGAWRPAKRPGTWPDLKTR